MWLVDLERALALLVGQTLGGMLAGPAVSREEKDCEKWLNSHLLGNGLENRDPERGQRIHSYSCLIETLTNFY